MRDSSHTEFDSFLFRVGMEATTVADSELQAPGGAKAAGAAAAPVPQAPPAETHRPLLRVDRTEGLQAQRHILVPVDDTEDSEVAIQWAIANLYRPGDVFHLLHVIPEPQMVHIWGGLYVPPDDDAELLEVEDTKDFVRHRFARALVDAKVPFQLHVIVGPVDSESVANVVCKKADALGAACTVMARHSKGRLRELWVGSVTKICCAWSKVPLAVVPHA